jgi:hypothetical protein
MFHLGIKGQMKPGHKKEWKGSSTSFRCSSLTSAGTISDTFFSFSDMFSPSAKCKEGLCPCQVSREMWHVSTAQSQAWHSLSLPCMSSWKEVLVSLKALSVFCNGLMFEIMLSSTQIIFLSDNVHLEYCGFYGFFCLFVCLFKNTGLFQCTQELW